MRNKRTPYIKPGAWADVRGVQDIGRFVAVARKESGLTQAELAARAGVPRRFVNELETGHSTLFLDRLSDVLQELGVRVVLEIGPGGPGGRTRQAAAHGTIGCAGGATVLTVPPVRDLGW